MFQLIYAQGMFSFSGGRLNNWDAGFNSYMCEECFLHTCTVLLFAPQVSIHICAGNVSAVHFYASKARLFQFIYVRGMFSPILWWRCTPCSFNSYMREECFVITEDNIAYRPTFQFIYVRGLFLFPAIKSYAIMRFNSYMRGECFACRRCPGCRWSCFNSYMCGECFRVSGVFGEVVCVSTHICAGNVSNSAKMSKWSVGFQFICARRMFQKLWGSSAYFTTFQLIYARGMFQESFALAKCCNIVSTHICAGNVSPGMFTMESSGPCFNSYMCGESFRCNSPRRVQGRFNSYMCRECFGQMHLRQTHPNRFDSYMCGECFKLVNVEIQTSAFVVSTYICVGNVSGRAAQRDKRMVVFQLIYVRGMFHPSRQPCPGPLLVSTRIYAGNVSRFTGCRGQSKGVSTHICAGNVSAFFLDQFKATDMVQLIYARGMFQHLCVVLPF